ncbi:MAG: hypothetical protein FWD66_10440 [Paludibacter sp.]|nr:hypothetical protein [Paludibacter sp.]
MNTCTSRSRHLVEARRTQSSTEKLLPEKMQIESIVEKVTLKKYCIKNFVLSNDNSVKHFGDNITAMHAAQFLG